MGKSGQGPEATYASRGVLTFRDLLRKEFREICPWKTSHASRAIDGLMESESREEVIAALMKYFHRRNLVFLVSLVVKNALKVVEVSVKTVHPV